ncbi:MAG: hypothetical protein IJ079_03785 [Lachnospiraceae bacterium]|nr:hypothetical protein [Lachnospiraceae bacterium]MBR1567529.1 hypothetical protein [Lachnospiraceae bacterium]MBR1568685.1 hypothetical protein [Lachnospiraceae bacterium]
MSEKKIEIGDQVIVTNPAYIGGAYGEIGTVRELDDNVQPDEVFAVMDIKGVEYCFNVKDLELADKR